MTFVNRLILSGAAGMFALLLFAGCRPNDPISKTTEPRIDYANADRLKQVQAMPEPAGNAEKIATRTLGAISENEEGASWFFKMRGPAEEVGKQESAFDSLLASVDFTKQRDKPVNWQMPEGWHEGPDKGRYATLVTGPAVDAVEVSVMRVGGSLLDNVNRWRGEVGLEKITADDLKTCTREVTTKQGKKLMRVDVSGMAKPGPAMAPFMKGK